VVSAVSIAVTMVTACGFGQTGPAEVIFALDFPNSDPEHYEISVSDDGKATYDSTGKLTPTAETSDSFKFEFTVSRETRERIFDSARRAKYFAGDLDSHKKNLASTGVKTLSYKDGTKQSSATFNYSTNVAVQQLTTLFQSISATMEFGRRLDYYHRYQKLGLDEELKRLENMSQNGSIGEMQALTPILQQIATDQTLINPVRARAQRLLALGAARN